MDGKSDSTIWCAHVCCICVGVFESGAALPILGTIEYGDVCDREGMSGVVIVLKEEK
jgi:hypothetical protein